jgi:hypothetical protein
VTLCQILQHQNSIVIFDKESPTDFSNAMELEDAFKLEKRGKKDYFKKKKNHDLGDQLYGWMAESEDFEIVILQL